MKRIPNITSNNLDNVENDYYHLTYDLDVKLIK